MDGRRDHDLLDRHRVEGLYYGREIDVINTELDLVLPGYTGCLQPLDVGMNKPFKDAVRKQFDQFMVNRTERQKVTRILMATWIKNAWDLVSEESIFNTWRKIGLLPC